MWARDPNNFHDLYTVLASFDCPGWPEIIPESSEKCLALKKALQDSPERYQKTFPQLAKELNIKAACSTIKRVMHNHHNI